MCKSEICAWKIVKKFDRYISVWFLSLGWFGDIYERFFLCYHEISGPKKLKILALLFYCRYALRIISPTYGTSILSNWMALWSFPTEKKNRRKRESHRVAALFCFLWFCSGWRLWLRALAFSMIKMFADLRACMALTSALFFFYFYGDESITMIEYFFDALIKNNQWMYQEKRCFI